MMNTLTKAINTLRLTKEVLKSKEFDNALSLATYKLDKIAKEEEKEIGLLKQAYSKERTKLVKLYNQHRKAAVNAFFNDFKAIYRSKELQHSQMDCKSGQIVNVFD